MKILTIINTIIIGMLLIGTFALRNNLNTLREEMLEIDGITLELNKLLVKATISNNNNIKVIVDILKPLKEMEEENE